LKTIKGLLISDFTINNLSGYLNNSPGLPGIVSVVAPFNQVRQVLLDHNLECWKTNPDFAFVFCLPQRLFESFDKISSGASISSDTVLKEVDGFVDQLQAIASKVKHLFVASFVVDPNRYTGVSTYSASGISTLLTQMNLRLSERINEMKGFYVLDAQRWINSAGAKAFQSKLWYLGKIPFHNSVF
jgi:predicted enzyme involved in methoxymalonyl-ACP biosynthesis